MRTLRTILFAGLIFVIFHTYQGMVSFPIHPRLATILPSGVTRQAAGNCLREAINHVYRLVDRRNGQRTANVYISQCRQVRSFSHRFRQWLPIKGVRLSRQVDHLRDDVNGAQRAIVIRQPPLVVRVLLQVWEAYGRNDRDLSHLQFYVGYGREYVVTNHRHAVFLAEGVRGLPVPRLSPTSRESHSNPSSSRERYRLMGVLPIVLFRGQPYLQLPFLKGSNSEGWRAGHW